MDISHRRIELQAPEDFSYLINNVRRAAADSINAAFPPVPDGHDDGHEDELRVRIEQMVDEYITKTFTYAAPNISINGLPVDPTRFLPSNRNSSSSLMKNEQIILEPEEQYEPFDARKRQRVEELAREEEDLLRSIASLKQRVPAITAQNWAKATKEAIVEDEKLLEVARDKVLGDLVAGPSSQEQQQQQKQQEESEMQIDGGDAEGQTAAGEEGSGGSGKRKNNKKRRILLEDIGPLERQDSVEEEYRGAMEILGRLKRDMPATVAKMERARVAGGYVVTGR
ncbi:putative kinetochore protein [Rhypophila decipiens]|uniref:Kinetochore protein n=1 Tax=Rhypophila decipiens TaxID=261697 RepID=A0AAN6YH68_9PEZI|nr:putative kinetochore protein [Rhypophila decipiens]